LFVEAQPQFFVHKNTDTFNLPYDYESVTHYAGDAYTKNGLQTIRTKDPKNQLVIGRYKQLSKLVSQLFILNNVIKTVILRSNLLGYSKD
jgi:hypothetical protein